MRRLGFSLNWPKLKQAELTTMRFPRRDKDWLLGESVMVVYQPRHFNYALGLAMIIKKEPRAASQSAVKLNGLPMLTDEEAVADGFENLGGLLQWLFKSGGTRMYSEPVNKLTLRWEYPARTREKIAYLEFLLEEETKKKEKDVARSS